MDEKGRYCMIIPLDSELIVSCKVYKAGNGAEWTLCLGELKSVRMKLQHVMRLIRVAAGNHDNSSGRSSNRT